MERRVFTFTVPSELDGASLKGFLKSFCKVSARTLAKSKRTDNGLQINGSTVFSTAIVHSGDTVTLILPEDKNEITPYDGKLSVLFENERFIVLDKPAGIAVHPVKTYQTDTLANRLRAYMLKKDEDCAFRAVNRLDKDTSGIVTVAKDRYTAASLGSKIRKTYFAICEGRIEQEGTINAPLGLKDGSKIVREVRNDGLNAVTHYAPLKIKNDHTLLKVWLETGRTHQIRCHMAYIGHPLAGDDLYGGSRRLISRQALHCAEIVVNDGVEIKISSPLPKDFFIR